MLRSGRYSKRLTDFTRQGKVNLMTSSSDIQPYRIDIPQADLDDLKQRLSRMQWPDELEAAAWDYGVPLQYMQDLVDYAINQHDWRKVEALLNAYPQFTTAIDGETVHFLHIRSPHAEAMPLMCTHGWPMSVIEYLDLIEPLTNPTAHGGSASDAFHLDRKS